mgnify:CR=1 FL=1
MDKKLQEKFSLLEKILNINFREKSLLVSALCHRSYLNEHPSFPFEHNERLEFLGDAVLELLVSEKLFKEFPEKNEGELTLIRANLVCAKVLSRLAKKLKLDEFLLLSKGEQKEKSSKERILANAFEALVGAIYLDQGKKVCEDFLEKNLFPLLEQLLKENLKDAKTQLQELVQEKLKITPVYRVLEERGPDHQKVFVVGVFLKEKMIGKGEGRSKQEAEEEAAKEALKEKDFLEKIWLK